MTASYAATIIGRADPAPVREIDLSTYLRPSRYAEADKFYGFADRIRSVRRLRDVAGEGVVVGGYSSELCSGVK